MKEIRSTNSIVAAVASACALALGIQSTQAQDFTASINAVSISTNRDGTLVYHRVRNSDFIRACAKEHDITNLMGLSLVYDRAADALEVIRGTNLTAICTPLSFNGGTWLLNSNATKAERLTFVFVETNKVAGGTLAATERFHYGRSNELTSFTLSGDLQYTVPASGTNPPVIYKGMLSARMPRGHGDEDNRAGHEDQDEQD